jgi:hypothetical protein
MLWTISLTHCPVNKLTIIDTTLVSWDSIAKRQPRRVALKLLIGGPHWFYVLGFAVLTVLLETFVRYSRYVLLLKWVSPMR